MITIRKALYDFTWWRVARVSALVLLFFVCFDIVLAKAQYAIVPREGRRNPKDSSAFVQLCLEELPKKSPRKRILFFGDSTIQGSHRISQKNTVPAQLEKELRKRPGWEDASVYNLGMVGAMPSDLLAAILLFADHEYTSAIVEVNHRKYGYTHLYPPMMNFKNLLVNFTRKELEENPPLDAIYYARPFADRVPEMLSLALRRVWFFYRFRGLWKGYFDSHDFKSRMRGRKLKEPSGWIPGQVKLERFGGLEDDYRRFARNLADKDSPGTAVFTRLIQVAREKGIVLKIYISPIDFKFISEELGVDEDIGRGGIEALNHFLGKLMEPMEPGWAFRDHTDALEHQVSFTDHEHLSPAGCRRMAKIIAEDFFSSTGSEQDKRN